MVVATAPTIGAACDTGLVRIAMDTGGVYVCASSVWTLPAGVAGQGGSSASLGPSNGGNWQLTADSFKYLGVLPARPGVSSDGLMVIDANTANSTNEAAQVIVLNPNVGGDGSDTYAYKFIPDTDGASIGDILVVADKTVDGFTAAPPISTLRGANSHSGVALWSDGQEHQSGAALCDAYGLNCSDVYTVASTCSTSLAGLNFIAFCY